MAEEAQAPSPVFNGIDFNPAFFPGTTSEYVEFPTAQGTVTFGSIFVTDIDTPTPSVDFDLLTSETGNINFGTSVPAGSTIKLGQSTGASIHCGSIDLQGTNINNAVASGTGTISLGPAQTTGTLNIGSHPTTATRTTGGINIGSNSAGVTPIVIGTTGQSTVALNGTSVNVGTKITSPVYDSTSATTAMTIGSNNTTSDISIGGAQTSGDINIGQNAGRLATGAVNISTSSTNAVPITIGSATSNTTLNGTAVNVTTKITSPVYDSSADSTAMTVGGNLVSGNLTIAGAQTTGDLFIGTGTRTSAADISIGTGANGAGNIFIGHQGTTVSTQLVKINTSTGASAGQTTIGSSTSATNIGGALNVTGLLTADGGLTLNTGDLLTATGGVKSQSIDVITTSADLTIGGSQLGGGILIGGAKTSGYVTLGNSLNAGQSVITNAPALFHQGVELDGAYGIKLTATSYTPASTQLGYAVEYTLAHVSVGTTSTNLVTTGSTIAIGRYLVILTWMCDTFSVATSNMTLSCTATNGSVVMLLGAFGASAGTLGYTTGSVSGWATITVASGILAVSGVASAGTISTKTNIKLIRVA
jgi:hypothetical protein